ncbi:ribosome small subunit-dependent GTPase A [Propionicicella superfundia]|uniref:ribosome small subunit-dependent GTPase A n=1 Tax=Propionicicella superfundia TaxID=348582 RepID=UPI0003FC745C|nr:ribosome small subunit-dependent GTPase A [Propionicicella superfundia]
MSLRAGIRADEQEGFGRPARRSRPRTKDRPDYSSAEVGTVFTVDRGRYRCDLGDRIVSATKARALGRGGVIVGDRVRLVGDTSGSEGTMARIVEVLPRDTVLRRTADDDDPYERPVVANADQLLVVTALTDPPPRPGMIDRILVAAYDAGIAPVLCLTKADLASPGELIDLYGPLDLPILVTEPEADLTAVREVLAGHRTVLVGHSGVGKSTLVNLLIPGLDRPVGEVNEVTGRGRHTSTSAIALRLPSPGGIVIDTPGVRSFGLSHVTPDAFLRAFSDLAPYTEDCPRGCDHSSSAPECGLDDAVAVGLVPAARLDSFRRLERAFTTPAT